MTLKQIFRDQNIFAYEIIIYIITPDCTPHLCKKSPTGAATPPPHRVSPESAHSAAHWMGGGHSIAPKTTSANAASASP